MLKEILAVVLLSSFSSLGCNDDSYSGNGRYDSSRSGYLPDSGLVSSRLIRSSYLSQEYCVWDDPNSYLADNGYTGSNKLYGKIYFDDDGNVSEDYSYPFSNSQEYNDPSYYDEFGDAFGLRWETMTNNFVQVVPFYYNSTRDLLISDVAVSLVFQWKYANSSTWQSANGSLPLFPVNPNSGSGVVGAIRVQFISYPAYSEGLENGEDYWTQYGYSSGYEEGYSYGLAAGYAEGISQNSEDLKEAYNRGLNEGGNLRNGLLNFFPNIFASVTALVYSTSHIQVLGISLFEVISLIVSVGILAVVLKVFLK